MRFIHLVIRFLIRPLRWLGRRRNPAAPRAPARSVDDFEPTQFAGHAGPTDAWGRSLAAEVSEEPLDTFPAALQDEFGIASDDQARAASQVRKTAAD